MTLPLAVTMGDPAGVGPEIIALALEQEPFKTSSVVIGDVARLTAAARKAGTSTVYVEIGDISEFHEVKKKGIPVLNVPLKNPQLPFGHLSAEGGACAYRCLAKAIDLAMAEKVLAIVTAPLNKESLNMAGHHYPGHTEILAELTGAEDIVMMLASESMRVLHVTTHIPLASVSESLSSERILRVIELGIDALKRLGISEPRFGIAGLNPHAGEGGIFGSEEEKIIRPAVKEAVSRGFNVEGPIPPDVVFLKMHRGSYDAVVAMYHDQGHIPLKLLAFESGVNVSLGLPIIRTSVDHGTAFDIAGKGLADPGSLLEALRMAERLAGRRA